MIEVSASSGNERPSVDYEKTFSREDVLKCPHMMSLLIYLAKKHNLPRYGWKKRGLRYHYTDMAGLVGIIQSGRLWATDIRFLNDPSEGVFFAERLLSLMSAKAGDIGEIEKKIIDGIRYNFRNPREDSSKFCVSLSANGDLLSQWRGYGGFGKGCAIGLNLDAVGETPQIAQYYDVVYGDEGLPELAVDLLDLFVSASHQWKEMMYDEWASTLDVLARSFKDLSYIEEQESRLICSYGKIAPEVLQKELPLRFRSRGSDVVPYIPIALNFLREETDKPHLPIERIIVGPGVDFERNYPSIRSLLKVNSYDAVDVVQSAIPFRS